MANTIFITTPCLNVIETLDRTILSVVTQAGDFFIRYHVQDGGSSDGTLERLAWWKRRLDAREFPVQCLGLEFTFASEPDAGMYDALCRGIEELNAGANSFMTWINADDILMQGALAFISGVENQFSMQQVSWVGGAASVLRGNMPIVGFDNPVATTALRAGLCDGVHWNFLQQEGTFFRKWLWNAIRPNETIRPMRLAGDWNLWRLFAAQSSLVQTKFTLGSFRIGDGQLSARLREKYMAEIDSLVSLEARRTAMEEIAEAANVTRRIFKVNYGDARLSIIEEGYNQQHIFNFQKVFGKAPQMQRNADVRKTLAEGTLSESRVFLPLDEIVTHENNILAYDQDWQFPAITEQHAFHQIRAMGAVPDNVTYIAYPWANLIDKLQTKAGDAHIHMARFRQFCHRLPKDTIKVTVCQHIKMREFLHLFEEAGVSEIFWSHATHADVVDEAENGVRLRAFPLYPVQVTEETQDQAERPHLFSFIGARSNQYYLTRAREWIIDLLQQHPRGMIIGRDSWHYNKIVYEHQIRPATAGKGEADAMVDHSKADQFKASLAESIFSLCPSGSGPNSIRLWESLGAGSIPVILADTWAPPGDARLWELATVFCKETQEAIRALPDRLADIAADPQRLAVMRHAMRQLWLLYGPQNFVNDVQASLLANACEDMTELRAERPAATPTRPAAALPGAPADLAAARQMLLDWSSRLLLSPEESLPQIEADAELREALDQACRLADGSGLEAHFRSVLAHSRAAATRAPAVSHGAAPKVCLFGRHSLRTPLSYAPIRQLIGDRITWVEAPEAADLVVTGFNVDLRENAERLLPLRDRQGGPQFVVMSEEPLWDVTWSGPFTGRNGQITVKDEPIPYLFLSHETSTIFDFDQLPYFVLTDDRYLLRYVSLMMRQARKTPGKLLEDWQTAPVRGAFFVEHRTGEAYSGAFPERDIARLSGYRTEVAEAFPGDGVLRVGKGWGVETRRQDLPDWHLDKLAHLSDRTQILSAYENVHQRAYVSEKIFDAFAVGAIPAYWAGEQHRVFDLVPAEAMINTRGMEAAAAAQHLAEFVPDRAFAEAWLSACAGLQARFRDFGLICAERRRVAEAALDALAELL